MNILWLTNTVIPIVRQELKIKSTPLEGWLDLMSRQLIESGNHITFLFPYKTKIVKQTEKLSICSFTKAKDVKFFVDLIKRINPDVIHIWGTEYKHTYYFLKAAKSCGCLNKVVVSLQGLISNLASHYFAFLPNKVINAFSFRDLVELDNVYLQQKRFKARGRYEIKALKLAKHVIGRTDYDRAISLQINENLEYHKCFETLRQAFYENKWEYSNCTPYSIFISSCAYPLKGFHIALEALNILQKKYSDAKIYVAGRNPFNIPFYRKTAYQKYICKLIKKYGLLNKVVFLGQLNEKEMCQQYLKSNVFVCCSAIENSPNSLGEAMVLNMPIVSSLVGGVANFIRHGENGFLYDSCEPYMLAYYIEQVFDDYKCLDVLDRQYFQFNPNKNYSTLYNLYLSISQLKEGRDVSEKEI